ncbi:MAG: hypothetical protein CMJ48_06550 [Planctomycetaceae bacterium]|nr:hypothetical protein [Planctomycetaceae bacterium]
MNHNIQKQKPRHPDGLHILAIGRVSTLMQNESNIEAGYKYAEQGLAGITDAPLVIKRLGEQSSGMIVDRPTMLEAYSLLDAGWPDVVVMEDVSKSYRNPRWIQAFVQDCVDLDVRVIAPGDNLDTFEENWEVLLGAAAMRHGLHIPDTRRRVRRTATKAFHDGGMVLRARYGYMKLTAQQAKERPDHPENLLIARLPECTKTIQHLRCLVVDQDMYGHPVADWLNDNDVPPGPYVKQDRWQWKHVIDLLRDPILYGLRRFRKVMHQPIFATGKHRRQRNDAPECEHWACLAHMTEAEWRELQAALDNLSPKTRPKSGVDHPRHRVPRSDSVTPHQHATCAICGAFGYPSGDGVVKCKNAWRDASKRCWNHVEVNCELAREVLVDLILARLDRHPQARQALFDAAWREMERQSARSNHRLSELDREIEKLRQQEARLLVAIKDGVKLSRLRDEAEAIRQSLKTLERQRANATEADGMTSIAATREKFDPRTLLLHLARTSFEFADILRRIVPELRIQPIQQIDTGQVRPRAILRIDLGALAHDNNGSGRSQPEFVTVDLFTPPVHIEWLPAVLRVKEEYPAWSYVKIGRHLKIGYMTVKRARDYHKLMDKAGLAEPYRRLRKAPRYASRWKPRSGS